MMHMDKSHLVRSGQEKMRAPATARSGTSERVDHLVENSERYHDLMKDCIIVIIDLITTSTTIVIVIVLISYDTTSLTCHW